MCWKYCNSSEFHQWEKCDWQLTVSPSECESDTSIMSMSGRQCHDNSSIQVINGVVDREIYRDTRSECWRHISVSRPIVPDAPLYAKKWKRNAAIWLSAYSATLSVIYIMKIPLSTKVSLHILTSDSETIFSKDICPERDYFFVLFPLDGA
jgi:hypothetical protein